MPRRKRARTGNLGTYSQKKARQEGGDDVEGGESDLDGAEQMGDLDHDEHVPWYTEIMEDDDADDTACQDVDKESILSIMSVDEDVPTLDESSLNLFLKKAMLGMQEVVQRGKSAVAKGIKATYAVKVGQKQSGRSERKEKRKNEDSTNQSCMYKFWRERKKRIGMRWKTRNVKYEPNKCASAPV